MNRRDFLSQSTLAAAAFSLSPFEAILGELSKQKKLGIQLFSLPKSLETDLEGTMKMLSKMGFEEIELFGPFPFSEQSAKDRWDAITPQLGFSGSGFFGQELADFKKILKDNGLRATSAHADFDTLQNGMERLGEAGDELGFEWVVLPSIPPEHRKNMDDYRRTAEIFNEIGEKAKKAGLKFAYHNHGYGFKHLGEKRPLEVIFEETEKDLVFFEMDVFWTVAGGGDPVDWLARHPKRYRLLHLKDMKEKKRFSGDGGDPAQWIELFGQMTTAGDGVLGLKKIVEKADEIGVKHFFVEQDLVAEPEIALKRSFDYLRKIEIKK